MLMHKPKFVVFEGPERAGKSFMTGYLSSRKPFEIFRVVSQDDRIERHDYKAKLQILDRMKDVALDKIHILDRFILTDLVYDKVVRNAPVDEFALVARRFVAENDVLVVKLKGERVKRDYVDDKIELSRAQFNRVVDAYDGVSLQGCVNWYRKIVYDSKVSETAALLTLDDIEFAFALKQMLVQEYYADDLWKFFVACICLNNAQGYRARKVVPEIFWHFDNPRSMLAKPYNLMEMLRPLGMQNNRAQALLRFTDSWLKEDVSFDEQFIDEDVPKFYGVGKYALDSHRLFIRKDYDLGHYAEPIDKELRKILEEKNR